MPRSPNQRHQPVCGCATKAETSGRVLWTRPLEHGMPRHSARKYTHATRSRCRAIVPLLRSGAATARSCVIVPLAGGEGACIDWAVQDMRLVRTGHSPTPHRLRLKSAKDLECRKSCCGESDHAPLLHVYAKLQFFHVAFQVANSSSRMSPFVASVTQVHVPHRGSNALSLTPVETDFSGTGDQPVDVLSHGGRGLSPSRVPSPMTCAREHLRRKPIPGGHLLPSARLTQD